MALLQQVTEQEGVAFVDANLLHAETYSPQMPTLATASTNHDGAIHALLTGIRGVLQALGRGAGCGSPLSYLAVTAGTSTWPSIHRISAAVMSRLDVSDGGAARSRRRPTLRNL